MCVRDRAVVCRRPGVFQLVLVHTCTPSLTQWLSLRGWTRHQSAVHTWQKARPIPEASSHLLTYLISSPPTYYPNFFHLLLLLHKLFLIPAISLCPNGFRCPPIFRLRSYVSPQWTYWHLFISTIRVLKSFSKPAISFILCAFFSHHVSFWKLREGSS